MACDSALVHAICPGIKKVQPGEMFSAFFHLGWTKDPHHAELLVRDGFEAQVDRVAKYPQVRSWTGSPTYLRAPRDWPRGVAWDVTPFEFANGPADFRPLSLSAKIGGLGLRALTGYALGVPEELLAEWHKASVAQLLDAMRATIEVLEDMPIFVVWKHNVDLRRVPLLTDTSISLEARLRQRALLERPCRKWKTEGTALKKNPTVWAAVKSGIFATTPERKLHLDLARSEDGPERRRERVLTF